MISAEVLKGELLNLSFTFSLCKLRQCIIEGRFQEMVALFNQFIEEISSSFSIIAEQLEALLKEGRGNAFVVAGLARNTFVSRANSRKFIFCPFLTVCFMNSQ